MDILRDMGVQGPGQLETRMPSASCHFPLMLRHMFKVGTALGKDTKGTGAGVQSVHCGVGSAACRHPNPVSVFPNSITSTSPGLARHQWAHASVRWVGKNLAAIITYVCVSFIY